MRAKDRRWQRKGLTDRLDLYKMSIPFTRGYIHILIAKLILIPVFKTGHLWYNFLIP